MRVTIAKNDDGDVKTKSIWSVDLQSWVAQGWQYIAKSDNANIADIVKEKISSSESQSKSKTPTTSTSKSSKSVATPKDEKSN